jgi:hypothetical protein
VGLASEFLTNGGDLGCVSFRLKGGDQAAQPRAQLDSAERFVVGKACEIAEQPAEPARAARDSSMRSLASRHWVAIW